MREPLHPAAVNLLLDEYHEASGKHAQVATVITEMVVKELAVPTKHRDFAASLVRSIVPPLLPQAKSAQQLNYHLAEKLDPLCAILTDANEQDEAVPPGESNFAASTTANHGHNRGPSALLAAPEPIEIDDDSVNKLDAARNAANRTYDGQDSLKIPQPDMQKLAQYHSGMFKCDSRNPAPGCRFESEIDRSLCIGVEDQTALCSRYVFAELQRRDTAIGKRLEEATVFGPDALQTVEIADLKRASAGFYNNAIGMESTRGPFYGLYVGPNFLLQDGGDWKEGVEVFASFNTEAFDRKHCPFAWICRGFFDATYMTPGAFPTEVEDDETQPIEVFDTKGHVRIRAGGQAHFNEYAGIELGVGVTSLLSDQASSVRAEPRVHIGAHFQTAYTDRAIGEVFIGYARDKAWERLVDQRIQQRFDRLLFEGTLIFPRLELGGFSLAARLSADVPWSGDTQSELRTSILLYYPFNSWLQKFRPTLKPAETAAP